MWCYVLVAATCIALNEELTATKIYFTKVHVFAFQNYLFVEVIY